MQRRTVLSVVGTTAPLGALGVGVASGHVGGARPDAPVERGAGMLGRPVTQMLALADEASPLHHVHGQAPPTLIVHGTGDDVVPEEQSAVLYEALVRHGVPSAHYEVRGGEHVVGLGQNGTAAARVRSHGLPDHARRPAFSAEAVVGFLDAVV